MNKIDKDDVGKTTKIWKEEVIKHFIRRMFIYYDPWRLMELFSPYDEYDKNVDQTYVYLLSDRFINQNDVSNFLFALFDGVDVNKSDLRRKADRMASDLLMVLS